VPNRSSTVPEPFRAGRGGLLLQEVLEDRLGD
jgi:hypothetical protein